MDNDNVASLTLEILREIRNEITAMRGDVARLVERADEADEARAGMLRHLASSDARGERMEAMLYHLAQSTMNRDTKTDERIRELADRVARLEKR